MSKERFWGEDKDREAARQLAVSEDHTIVYMATHVPFLYDSAEVSEQLDPYLLSLGDVEAAIAASVRSVELPAGWRLVGMRPVDAGADAPRIYGFVDFSSLGADKAALAEPQDAKVTQAEATRWKGLLLWALYHHQGGSSTVGQPIRAALGIGQFDALTPEQIDLAKDAVRELSA